MAEGNVKAELEEMRRKLADVEDMKKKMAEMERKQQTQLLELDRKRKDQDEILLQMMENATAANKQLTKMEAEIQKLKMAVSSTKITTRPEATQSAGPSVENTVHRINTAPSPLFTQISCFDLVRQHGRVQPDYVWHIDHVSQKLKQVPLNFTSNMFTFHNYPLQSRMQMVVNKNGNVQVSLLLEESGSLTRLKTIPAVYYVIKDQTGSGKHRSRVANYTLKTKFKSSLQFHVTLMHKTGLTFHWYNASDAVVIEVYVDPPAVARHVHSFDGTLSWVIDDYSRRKEMALEGLVLYAESPYFYTGSKGFRVRVRLWLNGYGDAEGNGVTVGVYFLTGEFDDALPAVFPHRTTVTLSDRREPQRGITKAIDGDVKTSHFYFVNMGDFQEIGPLVHNDSLFCKVSVQHLN